MSAHTHREYVEGCFRCGLSQEETAVSEYTPDTETVREQYTREQPPHIGTVTEKSAEFDRWLAAHGREVAARAKIEVLNSEVENLRKIVFSEELTELRAWLRARANEIEIEEDGHDENLHR